MAAGSLAVDMSLKACTWKRNTYVVAGACMCVHTTPDARINADFRLAWLTAVLCGCCVVLLTGTAVMRWLTGGCIGSQTIGRSCSQGTTRSTQQQQQQMAAAAAVRRLQWLHLQARPLAAALPNDLVASCGAAFMLQLPASPRHDCVVIRVVACVLHCAQIVYTMYDTLWLWSFSSTNSCCTFFCGVTLHCLCVHADASQQKQLSS